MTTISAASSVKSMGEDGVTVRRARQGLLVFAVFLIPLSLFGYWFNINHTDLPLNFPILPLMFAPGLASIRTRLVRREGFADVSFRQEVARLLNKASVASLVVIGYLIPAIVLWLMVFKPF